jgi:hypothetical protein
MAIRVRGGFGDLVADFDLIRSRAPQDMQDVVRRNIRSGATKSRDFARRSSGRHGVWYPGTIDSEMTSLGDEGVIRGEWGPDSAQRQGGMSFEEGSRNQKPHHDLDKGADIVAPVFGHEAAALPGKWFWPNR